jgi:hypothetical protein
MHRASIAAKGSDASATPDPAITTLAALLPTLRRNKPSAKGSGPTLPGPHTPSGAQEPSDVPAAAALATPNPLLSVAPSRDARLVLVAAGGGVDGLPRGGAGIGPAPPGAMWGDPERGGAGASASASGGEEGVEERVETRPRGPSFLNPLYIRAHPGRVEQHARSTPPST